MAINLNSALTAFNAAGVNLSADFHTLHSSQVDAIVEEARRQGYRAPKDANGSTARYFFSAVQRLSDRSKR